MTTTETVKSTAVLTEDQLLAHWQGHRALTRKVIEAFPEDKLFTYSVGGMRPFAVLALEMTGMALPGMEGIVTKKWETLKDMATPPKTKKELLELWDEVTDHINEWWPKIPKGRFQEVDTAFEMYEGPIYWHVFYVIDNEIHHRAQGYVYLRSLGLAPPPFWERG